MPKGKQSANKELEGLKKRRLKAQEKGDLSEEAGLCNVIGSIYTQQGDYKRALRYHRDELQLSESVGSESIDTAIAYRMVGECHCNLEDYKEAVTHHNRYLEIVTKLGDPVEEQRALTTLGRTYFMYSGLYLDKESEELLIKAETYHRQSLDACNRLEGLQKNSEILAMRAKCYINLGLVYEAQSNLKGARILLEKALNIAKELGDAHLDTVYRCHSSLGSLHKKQNRPTYAFRNYQAALGVTRRLKSKQEEIEILRDIAQLHLEMSNFEPAKVCLKKVLKLTENSQEVELLSKHLAVVRKIVHYALEVGRLCEDEVDERMRIYDKLGDLCCGVKAYTAAIEFYGKLPDLALSQNLEAKKLSAIYVSLGRTCSDKGRHSQALRWYEKDLEVCKGNPADERDTWNSIAKEHENANYSTQAVMEAYTKAADLAEQANEAKNTLPLYKAIINYCRTKTELESVLPSWERKLSELLDSHPELTGDVSYSSDEDSQDPMEEDLSDAPLSLPSSEGGEEEDEDNSIVVAALPTQTRSSVGYAVRRRKSKLQKKNEKGETPLHVAAIDGNVPVVKTLLKEGAEVNARDFCGWTPLHEACINGKLEVVRILLNNGAAINDMGGAHCDGVTPLIDAATNGHVDIVKLLVEEGANILLKDSHGRTALDVVEERLASDKYEPDEEHMMIHEFLVLEMKRLGYKLSPPKASSTSPGNQIEHSSKPSVRKASRKSLTQQRVAGRDRTGASILDSSDEEDEITLPSKRKKTQTPLKSLTETSTTMISSTQKLSLSDSPITNRVPKQTSLPALILEEDPASDDNDENFPVIDKWLVDDIREPPPKKPRSSSKERETRTFIGGSTRNGTSTRSKSVKSSLKSKPRQSTFQRASGSGSLSLSTGTTRRQPIEINSPHSDQEFEWMDNGFPTETESSLNPFNQSSSDMNGSNQPPPHQASFTLTWPPPPINLDAPMRVRVRIQSKSYLIPCPRKTGDGPDITIGWLADQAVERYYSDQGGRPKLSLTTLDGASLFITDKLFDVLGENEEVIAVIQDLPLNERYQMACRNAGVACHQEVLDLFQANVTSSRLDLSKIGLTLKDSAPLFEAIQSEHTLTCLKLTGNFLLRAKGVVNFTSALSKLSNLEELDLSCTGMTAQGLELVAKTSPGPWNTLHKLNLSYNNLGAVSGWSIAQMLKQCRVLSSLHFQACHLTAACFSEHSGLNEALKGLESLTEVSFSMNKIYGDGVSCLLQSLPPTLSTINLSATCCKDRPLTEALRRPSFQEYFMKGVCDTLEVLDLSLSGCDDEGVSILSSCLENCSKLRELKLSGNYITSDGVGPLCRLAECKSTLRSLDLSGNALMGNAGCWKMIRSCSVNPRCCLNLSDCGVKLPLPEGLASPIHPSEPNLNANVYYKYQLS